MTYLDTNSRTAGVTKNERGQPLGRSHLMQGVYMGFVKDTVDVQLNGRLRVWVPEMGSAPDEEFGWVTVNYCSPFAGATNVQSASKTNIAQFEGTQTSYGMWMVPPDINNQVIIMFIGGDTARGIWIGCLYNQFMNNMVPGMAADTNNYQYPGEPVPVAEYNKWDSRTTLPDAVAKPYEATKFNGVGNQGLIRDPARGITTTSARRESPSAAFGILTPGPVIDKNATPENIRRKGGSSFIMDDATGSEYVQLETKTGAQIRIDETNGFVYLINRDGTAWVQMDQYGNVDIFGASNISMRAQRDINLRADRNINIEAGQNIFMKAAKDTVESKTEFTYDVNNIPRPRSIPVWSYVGEGNGTGGNIVMQSLNNMQTTSQKGIFITTVENDLNINVANTFNLQTVSGGQNFKSTQGIKMTTEAAFDLAATGNIRVSSRGLISVVGTSGIIMCTDADISVNAMGNITETAAGTYYLDAASVGIGTNVNIEGSMNATSTVTGVLPGVESGGGVNTSQPGPSPVNPAVAEGAIGAASARPAEVKPMNDKINILATWQTSATYKEWSPNFAYKVGDIVTYDDVLYIATTAVTASSIFIPVHWNIYIPNDKFKRKSQILQTTTSRFPTYEPCPEHENFRAASIVTPQPNITPDDRTYSGSAGPANNTSIPPAAATNPGANNTSIIGDPVSDTSVAQDINTTALRNQLILHEGLVKRAYTDTMGLVTGGIGHLMRSNELPAYPVGTPISDSQIETWYTQDSTSAIKISQELVLSVWGDLSDVRKRAMIDLSYNLGKAKLAEFRKFLTAMRNLDFNTAGRELRNSAWFSQVGKRGPNVIAMIVQNVDPTGNNRST